MNALISTFLAATLSFCALVASGAHAHPAIAADGDSPPSSLTRPDGSIVPFPQGIEIIGPDRSGGAPAGAGQKSADPQATPDPAVGRKRRIDDLFARLAKAQDATEAEAITGLLNHLWLRSGSDTADLLMQRAIVAMTGKDNAVAGALLDKIVVLQPDWAEAWNKRATVRYLDDDDAGSMEDISHVLRLEPRHFGALSGMGFILHRNGDDKAALKVLRQAAAINPQSSEVKALIDELTPDVEGHEL